MESPCKEGIFYDNFIFLLYIFHYASPVRHVSIMLLRSAFHLHLKYICNRYLIFPQNVLFYHIALLPC